MAPGRITTFYSYKGGVGRSMAVANVAFLLAGRGRRVLVVDFDLEAPGIHRYFPESAGAPRPGVIELFVELRSQLLQAFPSPGDFDPTEREALATCRRLIAGLLEREEFFQPVSVAANVTVMRAGLFDEGYADRVRGFDWKGLFADFAEVFGELRAELTARYDDVLIDARTGLTDIGSISTVILPDRLVVAFVPNEQSLAGGLEVARQAVGLHGRLIQAKRATLPLQIVPLLSRVEPGELEQRASWMRRAAEGYAALFRELAVNPGIDMLGFFEGLHVPHSAFYAYGERVASAEDKDRGLGSLVEAYERLTDCLLHAGSLADWQSRRKPETTADDDALLVQFDARFVLTGWRFRHTRRAPDEYSTRDWRSLRQAPADDDAWNDAAGQIDRAAAEATRDLQGSLHVFPMASYPIAALLGRRLDDLARGVPIHLYQHDSTTGEWLLFSAPSPALPEHEPFFRTEEISTGDVGADVVIAIEGFRQLSDETLCTFGRRIGAGSVIRLRQLRDVPLDPRLEAGRAVLDLRRTLARVQSARPAASLHIVATAPVALLVEVGRMLSPTVYRKAIVYQYHAVTATYAVGWDVIGRRLIKAE